MNIFTMINENELSISLDCDLAILNNIPKNTKVYKNAYDRVKKIIIKEHFFDGFQYDEIDIKIEISQILEFYVAEN
jgi:hypothetical protein